MLTRNRPDNQPQFTQADVRRIAHDIVMQKEAQTKLSQVRIIRGQQVLEHMQKISEVRTAAFLLEHAPQLFSQEKRAELFRELPGQLKQAEEAEAEIAQAAADNALNEDALDEALLRAAENDPEMAAELLSADMGQDVAPEEVDQMVANLLQEEMEPGEGEKVASATFEKLSERSQEILRRRATGVVRWLQRSRQ